MSSPSDNGEIEIKPKESKNKNARISIEQFLFESFNTSSTSMLRGVSKSFPHQQLHFLFFFTGSALLVFTAFFFFTITIFFLFFAVVDFLVFFAVVLEVPREVLFFFAGAIGFRFPVFPVNTTAARGSCCCCCCCCCACCNFAFPKAFPIVNLSSITRSSTKHTKTLRNLPPPSMTNQSGTPAPS